MPDIHYIEVGEHVRAGEAKINRMLVKIAGLNIALNFLIEWRNEKRIKEEQIRIERLLKDDPAWNPTKGVLAVFRFTGGRQDEDSGLFASARFDRLDYWLGFTEAEARATWLARRPTLRTGVHDYFVWTPPKQQPEAARIHTPFTKVAIAEFADYHKVAFQKVEFEVARGFRQRGIDGPVDASGVTYRFLLLRMPPRIEYVGFERSSVKELSITETTVASGTRVPALVLNGGVVAVAVWAADGTTQELFKATPPVDDIYHTLRNIINIDLVRWVRPEQVRVLSSVTD